MFEGSDIVVLKLSERWFEHLQTQLAACIATVQVNIGIVRLAKQPCLLSLASLLFPM